MNNNNKHILSENKDNNNNKKQKLNDVNLNFKTDVCIYTQQETFDILYQEITLPDVLLFIIIEYSNIYRNDHLQPYKFYSIDTPFKTILLDRLLDEKDNGCKLQIISTFRQAGKTKLEIDFLLRKEIECKETNRSYNVAVITPYINKSNQFKNLYYANREYLNENWMNHDIERKTKNILTTTNKFKVFFQMKKHNKCVLDLIIVDEFELSKQLEPLRTIFQQAKRIIFISTVNNDDNTFKNNIQRWSDYINNGTKPIELIKIAKNSTDINDNTVSSTTEIINFHHI